MANRELWDARYDKPHLIHGDQPSDFLCENAGLLPNAGLALDLAAGEGRNVVFLAELGLEALALDISLHALQKCKRLAEERKVRVEAASIDLTTFDIPPDRFDVIVNFNYLQRNLAPQIVRGLKSGGMVVFETLTRAHLRWKAEFNPEFLLGPGELLQLFAGLHLIKYRETDLPAGASTKSVASIIAKAVGSRQVDK
jgi:tellurite methyltransferase